MSEADPFGTTELRRRVLDAWADSPSRRRADANLEADAALVGYRDRVLVELIQNAADAAAAAGGRAAVRVSLTAGELVVSNTGRPLSAEGVESIAVARASAKQDVSGAVGRFGIGFSAVLSVSDEPSISSQTGAVAWSRERALEVSEAVADGSDVAVLRLPFAESSVPETGMTTTVRLPLRDEAAVASVREQIDQLDAALLFAFDAIEQIDLTVDGRQSVLRIDPDCWWRVDSHGRLEPALLAALPAEQSSSNEWLVTWALPLDAEGRFTALPSGIASVVRAPTPTDERLSLPAVLVASYPVEVSRRHVIAGPATDAISRQAARSLVAGLAERTPDPAALALIAGRAASDAEEGLRHELLTAMRETAWLPVAGEPDLRQRASAAVTVPDALVGPLTGVVPGLLPAGWTLPDAERLGVRRVDHIALVDALRDVRREPEWWHELYDGLAETIPPGPARDVLRALPVPLVGGSLAIGPREIAAPGDDMPDDVDLGVLGVKLVHPAADHELLRSLGAAETSAAGLLDLPSVREAVEQSLDAEDPGEIADAVLALVAAAGPNPASSSWLSQLALPTDDDDWFTAGELLLPGGRMSGAVAADSGFGRLDPAVVERWGSDTLRSLGVVDLPVLLHTEDADGPDHDLDGEAEWWGQLPAGAFVPELVAVRDLEQVRDDAWPEVLAWLASEPALRAAVVEPVTVMTPDGGSLRVPSYTAWWLSNQPVLDRRLPSRLRLGAATGGFAELFDAVPAGLDDGLLVAIGVATSLADATPAAVLDALADAGRRISRRSLRQIYGWLAGQDIAPPERIRAVVGDDVRVVAATDAVIVDAPDLLPLLDNLPLIPVAASVSAALADRLDLTLASEVASFAVISFGHPVDSGEGRRVMRHDPLVVSDASGADRAVPWRCVGGVLHVSADDWAFGLGRGLAWLRGEWWRRFEFTEGLREPGRGSIRDSESDLDEE